MVVNAKIGWITILCLVCAGAVLGQGTQDGAISRVQQLLDSADIPITKVEVFSKKPAANTVLLENGYAQSEIKNPEEWPLQTKGMIANKIQVVFTQYPKNYEDWITNYDYLLSKRLVALYNLDSNLIDKKIEYELVLQSDCSNEFEAMQLFHGVRIFYKPQRIESKDTQQASEAEESTDESQPEVSSPIDTKTKGLVRKIRQFMVKEKYNMDSTVFNALDRNDWTNAHLVVDWTGSMYGHGAEAVLWHTLEGTESPIKKVSFFNDGDKKKNRRKTIGSTGGVYNLNSSSVSRVIKLMKRVKNKGNGGDSPENDLEALMNSIREHPQEEIILIADNKSCIRDFILLECIDAPIHIILCDTRKGINHQYLNLAWKTGGSIHTKNLDVDSLDHELQDGRIQIGTVSYSITEKGYVLPVDRSLDRFQYCNRYYRAPRKRKRSRTFSIECE